MGKNSKLKKHKLTSEELCYLAFGSKNVNRDIKVSEDGTIHILELLTNRPETSIWLIYAEKSAEDVKAVWENIKAANMSIPDDGIIRVEKINDINKLPYPYKILILGDAILSFNCGSCGCRKNAMGYIGYITGNEIEISFKDASYAMACIFASLLGPKTEFLKDILDSKDSETHVKGLATA